MHFVSEPESESQAEEASAEEPDASEAAEVWKEWLE